MTLVANNTLAVADPASESATPPAVTQAKPGSDHLGADAVSLDVPVKVHGSRVTEVVRGITPYTEPFEEETTTMIVFPRGGVLRLSAAVSAGQVLVLTNLKSRQDAICRVVKVRTHSNLPGYVEIEFTHPQPGYWGVHFPSDGPELARKVVPPAPPLARDAEVKERPAGRVRTPSEPPLPVAPPSDPGRQFISIGSQENVQAAASTAFFRGAVPPTQTETKAPAMVTSKTVTEADAPPGPLPPDPSIAELRGDAQALPVKSVVAAKAAGGEGVLLPSTAAEPSRKNLDSTIGDISPGSPLRGQQGFGAESRAESQANEKIKPSANWKLISAIAFLLIAILGGGVFLLSHHSSSEVSAPSAAGAATEPVRTSAAQSVASPQAQSISDSNPPAELKPENSKPVSAEGTSVLKASTASGREPSDPSPPVKNSVPNVTSDLSGVLRAHPVSSRHEDPLSVDSAPALDAGVVGSLGADSALLGIGSSSPVVSPPPQPESSANSHGPVRIRIGGQLKQPRLLSSATPVYPTVAARTHTEGDVVVKTVIDRSGRVTEMQVVSGPPILRSAALDALGRWKYEPSMLDGVAVSAELMVTIRFRSAASTPSR
jgi:periplasmic protein TonB